MRLLEYILAAGEQKQRYSEMSKETVTQLADISTAAETGGYCDWERPAGRACFRTDQDRTVHNS
ncbi:MAG: hypothetical protein ACI8R4_001648 [Paracoccaceae bacterium]|jgi:hypothetical protein